MMNNKIWIQIMQRKIYIKGNIQKIEILKLGLVINKIKRPQMYILGIKFSDKVTREKCKPGHHTSNENRQKKPLHQVDLTCLMWLLRKNRVSLRHILTGISQTQINNKGNK